MQQLKTELKNYTDVQLAEQLLEHHDEYTPEALLLLEEEAGRRNLEIEKQRELLAQSSAEPTILQLDKEDFKPFDHLFTRVDLELAAVILRDNEIPFYADNPRSTTTIPLESEAAAQFSIHVHKSGIEKAHELLDEHFEKIEGSYHLKTMSIKEQLKLFSFHELQLSEYDAMEEVEVSLSNQEKETIRTFGKKVLEESDQIEKKQDRVLFYYDTVETVIERLSEGDTTSFSKSELLTILEILQVTCDEPEFPQFMNESISSLLGFFRPQEQ